MTDLLPAIEFDPVHPPRASVIWLHGLGASGHDFEPLIPELGLVEEYAVRFVLPHAPERPVTINQGYVMPAWYDIVGMEITARQDEAGIRTSEDLLRRLIESERARGIAAGRIVLAGFSQGGAIALHTALRYPERLGGVLALSTYLPLAEQVPGQMVAVQQGLAVFMGHGDRDEIVPPQVAARSRDALQALGCAVEWHAYAMAHSVCPDEVADIRRWLVQRLG
jgi:phospholipase/carboxylesterase